jgi:hypothetical protein
MIELVGGPCAGRQVQVWVNTGGLHQVPEPQADEVWVCPPTPGLTSPVYYLYRRVGGVWRHRPEAGGHAAY